MTRGRSVPTVVALLVAATFLAPLPAVAAAAGPVPMWAYYYIWFNASSWDRAKSDFPLLGRYSSDQRSVMRKHIQLAKQAGIDGFIVSWKSTPVLNRRLRLLARVAARERFKLSIIYQGLDFERRPLPVARISHDLGRFVRTFSRMPALRGPGKPTVIWSGTWEFSPRDLASVTSRHRDRLRILASERNPTDYQAKAHAFDGDAYYWSSVNPDTYPGYADKLASMARAVHASGGRWLAPAAPGFDGRLVGHPTVVPRRDGDTLRRELNAAQSSNPDVIALISWNEFSENSHVEPSRRYGTRALEVLADVNGTKLKASGELDSSQPTGDTNAGLGAIPAMLAFVGLAVGCVYLLGRRRRSHAAR
jgi:Glycosyl hydrolase family 71